TAQKRIGDYWKRSTGSFCFEPGKAYEFNIVIGDALQAVTVDVNSVNDFTQPGINVQRTWQVGDVYGLNSDGLPRLVTALDAAGLPSRVISLYKSNDIKAKLQEVVDRYKAGDSGTALRGELTQIINPANYIGWFNGSVTFNSNQSWNGNDNNLPSAADHHVSAANYAPVRVQNTGYSNGIANFSVTASLPVYVDGEFDTNYSYPVPYGYAVGSPALFVYTTIKSSTVISYSVRVDIPVSSSSAPMPINGDIKIVTNPCRINALWPQGSVLLYSPTESEMDRFLGQLKEEGL
ncbi:MAG: hypothetical protein LBH19_10900, partial [Dysgonamonadaceae bacterium]|nr:hypothetical protein [Dysgonamonadaceae bacterium]